MNRLFWSGVLLLLIGLPYLAKPDTETAPAPGGRPNAEFIQMLNQTGCESKFSDEKKADIFLHRYKGRQMIVTGEINNADTGSLYIRVLPSTLTFDLAVDMSDRHSTYDLEKGRRVTVAFVVSSQGGCFLSFMGNNGVLQR